jgi:hypothetical protein
MSGGLVFLDRSDPNNKALLLTLLKESVEMCYLNDYSLIRRGGMEQASMARIYYYMQKALEQDSRFVSLSKYNLDSEYNKDGVNPKELESGLVRPDIILHFRDNLPCKSNILVVEFKMWSNNDTEDMDKDIVKLKEFTSESDKFHYFLGVSVKLNKHDIKYTCFQNGEESDEERTWQLD